jgi:hypothetical protein
MAKLVVCRDDEVDEVLAQHEEHFRLVAVIRRVVEMSQVPDIEERELYFEARGQ